MNILLLGSSSQSRQALLREVQIPFQVVGHYADEDAVPYGATLQDTVLAIAKYKMDHIRMPEGAEGRVAYILTADTMGADSVGTIHGKPKDRQDAISKIRACRNGVVINATAFCIEKRIYGNGVWVTEQRVSDVITSQLLFTVPDNWMDRYLEHSLGMVASGAIAIELYGAQFLQSVTGSYSSIVGLPVFEVREALEKLGFFD
jgi:septum formation protein